MSAGAKFETGDRFPCPCCGAYGCKECDGFGRVVITEKPDLPEEIWETLIYAKWMENGLPPVAGGVLDQDHWFITAATFVSNEGELIKAELLKDG